MASKTKNQLTYHCVECGWKTAKWVGRCANCQTWGTIEEINAPSGPKTQASTVTATQRAKNISEIDASFATHHTTDIAELDRVLGGGLIPGAVILMAGEPGIGKSTLVLDMASRVARQENAGRPKKVLYITGEESTAQVKMRADRISALAPNLFLVSESDLGQALGQIAEIKPDLFIVDSVQTLQSEAVEGTAGGVTQIREVTNALIATAKKHNMTAVLVGHVTKDGNIAGPRMLEHLVDVVCQFEGQRHSRLRMLRAAKNRYGATDEVGCFDLSDTGISSVSDPSGLFLTAQATTVAGTAITVTLEGQRPLISEVQTLLDSNEGGSPRRTVSGLDTSRVNMLLAVLQQRARFNLRRDDVYASTVGGIKVTEPAADLAIAVALASSKRNFPVPGGLVVFGEIGLAGELRPVPGMQKRILEAARLGFTRAVVPFTGSDDLVSTEGMVVRRTRTIADALEQVFAKQNIEKHAERQKRHQHHPAGGSVTPLPQRNRDTENEHPCDDASGISTNFIAEEITPQIEPIPLDEPCSQGETEG